MAQRTRIVSFRCSRASSCLRRVRLSDFYPFTQVADRLNRCTAVTPLNWRTQRVSVHSLTTSNMLSKSNMPTGLPSPPRDFPSHYLPRHGSLVFHPTEMLYGVGCPDGSGTWLSCLILSNSQTTSSSCYGMQINMR